LPTKENKCPFSVSPCSKSTEVCRVYREEMEVVVFSLSRFQIAEVWKRGDMDMERWRWIHGDIETRRHRDMKTWRRGDMETLRHEGMGKLRHCDMETWRLGDMGSWGHADMDIETRRHGDMETWRH
jgi:hypothetical protein